MGGPPISVSGHGLIGTAAGETPKLELGLARFKARWGWAVRGRDVETVDALNWMEVIVR